MASPQGFLALILSPVYWNPKRIMFLGIGVEDILFCFVVGGLVWMAISTVFQDKIVYDNDVKRILLRYLICSLTGILITLILYYSGFKSMVNPFITMTIWISVLIVIKKKYLIICLTGSFVFLLIYTITFIIVSKIWPDLLLFWSNENLSGHTLMNIPIEELIWAFLYGGSWSAAMAFILRVNFKSTLSSIKDPI